MRLFCGLLGHSKLTETRYKSVQQEENWGSCISLKAIWVIILLNQTLWCKSCRGVVLKKKFFRKINLSKALIWSRLTDRPPADYRADIHCWHISSNLQTSERDVCRSEPVNAVRDAAPCEGGVRGCRGGTDSHISPWSPWPSAEKWAASSCKRRTLQPKHRKIKLLQGAGLLWQRRFDCQKISHRLPGELLLLLLSIATCSEP